MKTTIKTNGLSHESIYRLFPMVYAINTDGDMAEVQHDVDLVFPADEAVEAEIVIQKWNEVRHKRMPLLHEADILVNQAQDVGINEQAARAYRQALRDITKQDDPDNVKWPIKP